LFDVVFVMFFQRKTIFDDW